MREDGGLDAYHAPRQQAASVIAISGKARRTRLTADAQVTDGASSSDAEVGFLLNVDLLNVGKLRQP